MLRLGCIADDFTGGTDVAAALRRAGLSVALLFDAPDAGLVVPPVDAVVIALKTRTVPAKDAVVESLAALAWLEDRGAAQVYFKYCSTFDSTDDGNIGPVADALLEALGESSTLFCPASPEHGRTMYRGHLFVGDALLSESSMRHHPLTPMTDANIPRVLQRQTDGSVERISLITVRNGADDVTARLAQLAAGGSRHVVVDAISEGDLLAIAEGSVGLRLLTGGAGLAGAAGAVLALDSGCAAADVMALPDGPTLVLAGSCSAATLAQVGAAAAAMPSHRLDPAVTPDPDQMLATARAWLYKHVVSGPAMIYSSAGPDDRAQARAAIGPDTADILERTLGVLAVAATDLGVARIVVAGGETSGAVVKALGVRSVVVGHDADRGVPWCLTTEEPRHALLLKSGNFGSEDLLVRATKEAGR